MIDTTTHNDHDTATAECDHKAFATMAAQCALQGHTLTRSNPNDGPVTYYASRWGLVRHLPNLDAVRAFVRMVGGGYV